MNPDKESGGNGMPMWIRCLIIVSALPVLALPWLWAGNPDSDTGKVLLWLYPAYVVLSTVCAYKAWRNTPELTWILIVLLLLTHGAMYILCYPPQ